MAELTGNTSKRMKRPLIGVAIAYIIGLLLGEIFYYFPITVILFLIFLLLLIDFFYKRDILYSTILFGIILSGLIYYQFVSSYLPLNHISNFIDKGEITFVGRVVEPVRYYKERAVLILETEQISLNGEANDVAGRIRLTVRRPPDRIIAYGDIVETKAYIKAPNSFKNPGGFDYRRYMERKGIRAIAVTDNITIKGRISPSLLGYVYNQRGRIQKAIQSSLKDRRDESAILQAMIIGEKGDLTNRIRDNFMASGTTHILSISGTHLSLMGLFIFTISRWLILCLPQGILLRITVYLLPSQIAALITLPPIVYYALLAGGQVATIRALIMIVIYLIAILIQRERDLLNSLAVAAILVLVFDPQALFSISFQLSYMAALFISLSMSWWKEVYQENGEIQGKKMGFLALLTGKIVFLLFMTIILTIGTAPLVAYYFNYFSWVGILSNCIIIPFVGIIILPFGLFSSILSLFFDHHYLPFAPINQYFLSIFYGLIKIFSRIPFAEIHLPSPSILFLSLFYSYLFLIFYIRLIHHHKPLNLDEKIKALWTKRVNLSIGIILIFLLIRGIFFPYKDRGILRITYIDVGQGDSALIEFPDSTKMLIDGGRALKGFDIGRLVVAPYLWDRGIRRLDYIVATHPQLDHIGGLNFILYKFDIGEVWTNGMEKDSFFYKEFKRILKERDIPVRIIYEREDAMKIGGCNIHILSPSEESIERYVDLHGNDNNLSIVLNIVCGRKRFLFPGDIERDVEAELDRLDLALRSDVIKVPHHGGRSSLNRSFISKVDPEIAVISVGENNGYGHPTKEVLSFYKGMDAKIYRTDRDGAVIIRSNGEEIDVRPYLEIRPKKLPLDTRIFFNEISNLKRLYLLAQ